MPATRIQRESPSQAYQRTTHDRNSFLHSRDTAELLPDSGFVRNGISRPPYGFRGPLSDGSWERSAVQGETGEDRASASSYGYRLDPQGERSDSRLTFPLRVKIAVALGSALFVAAVWMLPRFIVKLAGAISHLSGVNWLIIGGSAYLLLSILFFSLVRIAAISDRRAAEMGGRR